LYGSAAPGTLRPFIGRFVRDTTDYEGNQYFKGSVFGPEGSGRDWWTSRGDFSAEYTFAGWGESEWSLGFGLFNGAFGRVARAEQDVGLEDRKPVWLLTPQYTLPPIPTVTLTIRF